MLFTRVQLVQSVESFVGMPLPVLAFFDIADQRSTSSGVDSWDARLSRATRVGIYLVAEMTRCASGILRSMDWYCFRFIVWHNYIIIYSNSWSPHLSHTCTHAHTHTSSTRFKKQQQGSSEIQRDLGAY